MKTEIDRLPAKPQGDLVIRDKGRAEGLYIGQLCEELAQAFAVSEADYAPLDMESVIARANKG